MKTQIKKSTRPSMKPLSISASALLVLCGIPAAHAGTYFWDGGTVDIGTDGNGLSGGTLGTWDNALLNWDAGVGPHVAWNSTNNDTAVLGGTAGIVTLGDNVSVGGLTFNTTGYTITGVTNSKTLTFGAANNTVLLNNVAAATIAGTVTGTGNLTFTTSNPATASTVTFSGVSSGGWSGTTTINPGVTLATTTTSGFINKVLNNTSSIAINGGVIQFNRATNAALGAISDTAAITARGGTFSVTSADAGGASANETIGAVTVAAGQFNFVFTNTASSGQTITVGAPSTTGLSRAGSTAAVTFSGGNFATNKFIVTGAGGATAAGQIVGPWATTGTSAAAQTDYAAFNASNEVVARAIAASAESTWTNSANAFTANAGASAGGSTGLTATRTVAALRSISGANAMTVDNTTDTFSLASNTFANGDAFVLGGTAPTGLTAAATYYVVNKTGNTFQVATAPGGTPIDFSTNGTSVTATGAITLSSGNNLETYGLLNGVTTTTYVVANGTGALTTPAGGGNLHINAGSGAVTLNAPLNNNGSDAVTLVKNGNGTLTLGSSASNYSGGTVLNAGTIVVTADAQLGAATGGVTVNGPVTLSRPNATTFTFNSGRTWTINDGAVLTWSSGNSGQNFDGVLTGNGTINNTATTGLSFRNTANDFTGTVNNFYQMLFASIGDSSNPFNLVGSNSEFQWTGGAKNFALRPLTLNATGTGNFNNNGTGAIVIQQNLAISGAAGARTLSLGGSNTNANVFAGNIADGAGSVVGLTKGGAGNWALSGTNSYSGTTVNGFNNPTPTGSLIFQGMQALSPNTNITQTHVGGSGGHGIIRFLDDSATPASRSTVNVTFSNSNGFVNTTQLFVGNNSVPNGGSTASTQTNSTIQLGAMNFTQGAVGATAGQSLIVTGANGYKLQLAGLNANLVSSYAGAYPVFVQADAPVIVAGTVQQTAGSLGTTTLTLTGSATGSQVSGNILNSADATAKVLSLAKTGGGNWTLSGTNAYTGTTSISAGVLRVTGNSSAATGAVTVTGGALGGNGGSLGGTVALSTNGSLNLADGSVGNLSLASTLALNGTAGTNNLYFDLANAGSTTDQVAATGAFSMTTSGAGVVSVNQLGGAGNRLAANTYDLLTASGGITAGGGQFQLAATKAFGQTFSLSNTTTTALKLTTTQVTSAVGNVTLSGTNPSWLAGGNFTGGSVPDFGSNVTINSAIGTTGTLGASTDINSLTYETGATTNTTITPGTAAAGTPFNMLVIEAGAANGNTAGNGITLNNTSGSHTISANIGLAASQTWTTAAGSALSVSGAVSDFGGGYSLTKAGAGTLTLTGANTYSGSTIINGGTLIVNTMANGGGASALGASSSAAANLQLGNGATLKYTGGNVSTDRSFTLNGTANGDGASLDASGSNPINFTNTAYPAYGTNNQTRTLTLTGTQTGANTLAAKLIDNGTGAVSLIKSGAGSWTLSGTSTFSGGTTISGGTLTAATSNSALGTGTVTLDPGALRLVVNDGLTIANNITINAATGVGSRGLIENSNTGNATLSGGTITITSAVGSGAHFASFSTGTLTVADVVNSSVPVSVRLGTVIFSGGGTYSALDAFAGTIKLGANNGLSTSATVNIGLATGGASLDLAGFNQSLVGLTKGATSATVGNSSTTSDSLLTTTGTSTYAGVIQNTVGSGTKKVALAVNGGSLTLSGANTYTGTTAVTAGELVVTGSLSGTASVDVGNGTNAAKLSGNGALTTAIAGAVTIANNATLAPGLSAAGLTIGAGTSSPLALQSGSTFELSIANNQVGAAALGDYAKLTLGSGVATTIAGQIVTTGVTSVDTGDLFTIMLNSGSAVSGTFSNTTANLVSGSTYAFTSGGQAWLINYAYTAGSTTAEGINAADFAAVTGGTNVALLAVPEPGALVSLLGGFVTLLGFQRRRRA